MAERKLIFIDVITTFTAENSRNFVETSFVRNLAKNFKFGKYRENNYI